MAVAIPVGQFDGLALLGRQRPQRGLHFPPDPQVERALAGHWSCIQSASGFFAPAAIGA
jgi:hypothetical protein